MLQESDGKLRLNSAGGTPVQFCVENTIKMELSSSGNVGIGTTGAGSLLTVAGDTSLNGDLDVENNVQVKGDLSINTVTGTHLKLSTSKLGVGRDAGQISQGSYALAIGDHAGNSSQGQYSVAVGNFAGETSQGFSNVAIGNVAGRTSQGNYGIAIGFNAGNSNQVTESIAVGSYAGTTSQATKSVAIGSYAGNNNQGEKSVAIGNYAGKDQSANSVAIGNEAGEKQGQGSIAIGNVAGKISQGGTAVAIGQYAGNENQSLNSVALGHNAGKSEQDVNAVALGYEAALTDQSLNAVAIGYQAGYSNQGKDSIAIGSRAGVLNQHSNTIALNATGVTMNTSDTSGLYIAPVRETSYSSQGVLYYNSSTKEITYDLSKVGVATGDDLSLVYLDLSGTFKIQKRSVKPVLDNYVTSRNLTVITGTPSSDVSYSIFYSLDGIDYIGVKNSLDIFTSGRDIVYDSSRNMWFGAGLGTYSLAYSYDGIEWHGIEDSKGSNFSTGGRVINAETNLIVAGGEGTRTAAYSSDGLNWTYIQIYSGTQTMLDLIYHESTGRFYGGFVDSAPPYEHIKYSTNGSSWTGINVQSSYSGLSSVDTIGTDGSRIVAGFLNTNFASGGNFPHMIYSDDNGSSWNDCSKNNNEATSKLFTLRPLSIKYANGIWIAGGQQYTQNAHVGYSIARSTDGITWTGVSGSTDLLNYVADVDWTGVRWVATGAAFSVDSSYSVLYSDDNGLTWSGITDSSKNLINQGYGIGVTSSKNTFSTNESLLKIKNSLIDTSNAHYALINNLIDTSSSHFTSINSNTTGLAATDLSIAHLVDTSNAHYELINTLIGGGATNDISINANTSGLAATDLSIAHIVDTSNAHYTLINANTTGLATTDLSIAHILDTSNAHYTLINANTALLTTTAGIASASKALVIDSNKDISGLRNITGSGTIKITGAIDVGGDLNLTGQLTGPSTLIIDPAAVGDNTGVVIIKGGLQVDGSSTIINSSLLDISDHRILLASSAPNSAATDGAGIEISGNKKFTYNATKDVFESNIDLSASGITTTTLRATNIDLSLQSLLDTSAAHFTAINANTTGLAATDLSIAHIVDTSTAHFALINTLTSSSAVSDISVNANTTGLAATDLSIAHIVDTSDAHYTLINTNTGLLSATAGTASASKALIVDSNVDITGIRYLTVSGEFKAGYNTNATSFLGRAAVGYAGYNDMAGFAHIDNNNTSNYALLQNSTGGTFLNAASSKVIAFRINNVDKMKLTSDGKFGIGTPSPTSLLHVAGDVSLNGYVDISDNLTVSGSIITSGSITGSSLVLGSANISEAELETIDGITAGTASASKALVLDGNKDIGTIRNLTIDGVFTDGNYTFDTNGNVSGLGTVGCGAITSGGNLAVTGTITADTSITLDSTTITTAELGVLDSVTAGTATASKALVLDSNKDIGTIRNLTIDGVFTDGNYTFDTNGNVSGLGTIGCGTITTTGQINGPSTLIIDPAGVGDNTGVVIIKGGLQVDGSSTIINSSVLDISDHRILLASSATNQAQTYGAGIEVSGNKTFKYVNGDVWESNIDLSATGITTTTLTATNIVIGSADINESELETIDGVTAGTASASKALVLDSNKDIGTIRNLTINGVFTDGNYTFDTNGNVSGLGTVGCGAITSGGNLAVTGTITADTSITLDSTTITTAELGVLDGVTAGTASASKALVLNSNKDIGNIRNITINGVFSDGNYTFDTNGNVSGLGTVGCGAITSGGNLEVVGDISCSGTLQCEKMNPSLLDYQVIQFYSANTDVQGFLYVKNMLVICKPNETGIVTGNGSYGWFPDIFSTTTKVSEIAGVTHSVGIIDTNLFDIKPALVTTLTGGNTANTWTGTNSRWGIQIKVGGLYKIEYTFNMENEAYTNRATVQAIPVITCTDSNGNEITVSIDQAKSREYTRDDSYGQYCCMTGSGIFNITNATANKSNGAWIKINTNSGKSQTESFTSNMTSFRCTNANITMSKLGEAF